MSGQSTGPGVFGTPDQRRRWTVGAVAVATFFGLAAGGFRAIDYAFLVWPALGYSAWARWPRIPDLAPAVVALVFPIVLNLVDDLTDASMFLVIIAVVALTVLGDRPRVSTAYVIVAIGVIAVFGVLEEYDWGWENWIFGILVSWAFSLAVRAYEQVVVELRATQARMIDQATLLERRRIARDVHDLVGHSLSVVMLHVAGARRVVRTDPDEAEAALRQAEDAARTSMGEIRRTIGLMREDGEGEGTAPAPDLTDIAGIVEQYRAAGLDVTFETEGPLEAVEGPAAVACCRIAQEALANVVKHTVGAEAHALLEVDDDHCHLRVRNRGGTAAPADDEPGAGHGLVGMRERALSVGGSLIVGPSEGGWSVDVTLPRDGEHRSR